MTFSIVAGVLVLMLALAVYVCLGGVTYAYLFEENKAGDRWKQRADYELVIFFFSIVWPFTWVIVGLSKCIDFGMKGGKRLKAQKIEPKLPPAAQTNPLLEHRIKRLEDHCNVQDEYRQ